MVQLVFRLMELSMLFPHSSVHPIDGDANFIEGNEIANTKVSKKKKGGWVLVEFMNGLGEVEHLASTYLKLTSF